MTLIRIRGLLASACFSLILAASAQADEASAGIDFESLRGNVVVVDFWASWCVPCRRSFPWLNQMQARYADDGLVIIGVNMDSDRDDATAFLKDYPADFDIVYDPEGQLASEFQVIAMPSSYIFDRDGNQVAKHLGFKVKQQDEYEALLVEILEK